MKTLLCLSDAGWRVLPARTQNLLMRMPTARILFFEPPAVSLPLLDGEKKRRRAKLGKSGRNVRDTVTVYSLPSILPGGESHGWIHRHNQKKLGSYIRDKVSGLGLSDPVVWVSSPLYAGVMDYLTYSALVYDGCFFPSSFPDAWEKKLASEADVAFAASHRIFKALSEQNKNVFLLPGGFNHALFSPADSLVHSFPAELFSVKNPILGFTGTIWADTDLSYMEYAAAERRDWSFVLIGKVRSGAQVERLKSFPNVYFLGRRQQAALPRYLMCFDVLLDLCRNSRRDSDVVPERIYEYLAMGKPIVSSSSSCGLAPYEDVVYQAGSASEFLALCTKAIRENSAWKEERRRAFADEASWKARCAEAVRRLRECGIEL